MKKGKTERESFIQTVAEKTVKARLLLISVFIVLCVFCVFGLSLSKTNNDITSFLSEETETARGLRVMREEFPEQEAAEQVDYASTLAAEMTGVLLIAAAVILLVLLVTSSSWFEVVICFIVFAVSALLNMGTTFLLGTVSAITYTVAVILQLALSIDYAIILLRRFREEREKESDPVKAASGALAGAIREIASSSVTTVAGLLALILMHFRFGADLGLNLAKGVVCSMLTVFFLMPALLILFRRPLEKTRHRELVPSVYRYGKWLSSRPPVLCAVFLLVLIPFTVLSFRVDYAFSGASVTRLTAEKEEKEEKEGEKTETAMAVLVPAGNGEAEIAFIRQAEKLPEVSTVLGYAGLMSNEELCMYSDCTPAQFGALTGTEAGAAELLYRAIALEKGDVAAQFRIGSYTLRAGDTVTWLFEHLDTPLIRNALDEEKLNTLTGLKDTFALASEQLLGKTKNRIAVTTLLPADSPEASELLSSLRGMANELWGEENVMICGDITSARDLRDSFSSDSLQVSLMTVLFVFLILLVTFRDPLTALELVFIIQGSIWINFGFTALSGQRPLFVTQMIGTAIQMGATVDYAIVLAGRYRDLRALCEPKEAAARALNESFATVMTSGTIMTAAGLLIAWRVSDVYISHIGLIVGRGALISVILVLTVLPQLLRFTDSLQRNPNRVK